MDRNAAHANSLAGAAALERMLPRVPLPTAAAARVSFDARFADVIGSLLGGRPVRIGKPTTRSMPLRIELSSLAGDLSVEVDPRDSVALSLIARLAQHPARQSTARDLASEIIDGIAKQWRVDPLGLRVRKVSLAPGDVIQARFAPVVDVAGMLMRLIEVDGGFGLFASEELRGRTVPVPQALHGLRLRGRCIFGWRMLNKEVLRSIEAGDLMLLGTGPLQVEWRVGARGCMAASGMLEFERNQIRLQSDLARHEMEQEMASEKIDHEEWMDELELPIQFELDSSSLRLNDLAALKPGHIVSLDVPVSKAVIRLTCNGQVLGKGQLIAVGDQLGICIEKMNWSGHAAA
ncbi:MAG: FliM/FliN family flagellar motor switch protein [Burkholderiales bacterium]|jgi:type III secretion protein Q|nr:FliM/FliN family flagellar motor switch protein [Burkholderiales bacterium]